MRIFISTGEVSGDLQGALLVEALLAQASQQHLNLEIVARGGDRMAAAGAEILANTIHIGSVGLLESLPFVYPSWRIQQQVKRYLAEHPPDLLILIDYPGPNLAIGNFVRQTLPQVPIIYYIAPQDWIWSPMPQNTQRFVAMTDRLLAIFPEEARYFRQKGMSVSWVGHPLLDRMQRAPDREQARSTLNISPDQTAIALLPASRQQEVKYLLPVICQAAQQLQAQLPNCHFWIPVSLPLYRPALVEAIAHYRLRATIVEGQTLTALAAADCAITKSGTVNLELALLNVPQVVLYRVSPVTIWFARKVLKFAIPFMSPVNLVPMKVIVPELLQEAATPERIVSEVLRLFNPTQRQQMLADYAQMRSLLGEVGVCDRAAQEILQIATHPETLVEAKPLTG